MNYMTKINVYLPAGMAAQLHDLADQWEVSTSLVARAVLEDFLVHREREVAILGPQMGSLIDTRTDAQREAAERAIQSMLAVDLELVAEQMTHPPQTC